MTNSERQLYNTLEAARLFIEREFTDPAQEEFGEWLDPDARPVHTQICVAQGKALESA